MSPEDSKPTEATRTFERERDAKKESGADSPQVEISTHEVEEVDSDVAKHSNEMNRIGAKVRGEGSIET